MLLWWRKGREKGKGEMRKKTDLKDAAASFFEASHAKWIFFTQHSEKKMREK